MLIVIKWTTSTNLNQTTAIFRSPSVFSLLLSMLAISTAIVVTTIRVRTASVWLAGQGSCLALLCNAKNAASFYSGRWNTDNNPDLAFACVGSSGGYFFLSLGKRSATCAMRFLDHMKRSAISAMWFWNHVESGAISAMYFWFNVKRNATCAMQFWNHEKCSATCAMRFWNLCKVQGNKRNVILKFM